MGPILYMGIKCMTKTPITDKLQKYLKLIEKIALPNQLDTGFDTSVRNKAWTQSGQDFDKFFGLDNLKAGLADPGDLEPRSRMSSTALHDVSSKVGFQLFGSAKSRTVDTLVVSELQQQNPETGITAENSNPYVWRSNSIYQVLTEGPISVSATTSEFYRLDKNVNLVYVKRMGGIFTNAFYATSTEKITADKFLYSGRGIAPKAAIGPSASIQTYAANNYSACLNEAIEELRPYITNTDNLFLLDSLKGIGFSELPSILHDSLLLGIVDAANTGTSDKNQSIPSRDLRIGHVLLNPSEAVLSTISGLVNSIMEPDDVFITEPVKTAIKSVLNTVAIVTENYIYDENDGNFIQSLIKAAALRKFNMRHVVSSGATSLYFILSQLVNQISKAFDAIVESSQSSFFYFGKLGYDKNRSSEQKETLGHSFVDTTCPLVVIKGIAGPTPGDSNNVFQVGSYVIDIETKTDSRSFSLASEKVCNLTSMIHNYILLHSQNASGESNKQRYIDQFMAVLHSASSIQNASLGQSHWHQILNTCYEGENKFKSGVFFVGVSPLFWDKSAGGGDILVCANENEGDIINKIKLPYLVIEGSNAVYSKTHFYPITSAIQIYLDKTIHLDEAGNPEGEGDLREVALTSMTGKQEIQRRHAMIRDKFTFEPLSVIRERLLQELYQEDKSTQQDLAVKAKRVLYKVFKNVEAGFWTMEEPTLNDGKEIACYDPWVYGPGGKTRKFRFREENTRRDAILEGRQNALSGFNPKKGAK